MHTTAMQHSDPATLAAMRAHLEALPVDDEPVTDEDREALADARRELAAGATLTTAELLAELARPA